jgi:hypothetical protein
MAEIGLFADGLSRRGDRQGEHREHLHSHSLSPIADQQVPGGNFVDFGVGRADRTRADPLQPARVEHTRSSVRDLP